MQMEANSCSLSTITKTGNKQLYKAYDSYSIDYIT